ncbi:NAD-binding protein [Pseudonocardia sp. 73-21]|uniref:FAD binding domain-containing protein n=1 Tax=Pseudonocardia sp. 73-21 TaxID=1895809 RepID=UPI002605E4FD|nr:NAD-binding protein [Pseudonocardia sp. 73-21]
MSATTAAAMPAVAVVGGSLGGLTAALLLRDIGCDVTVYERSRETLQARGAGIAVLPETLRYPVERLGIPVGRITSSTDWIRFLERDGSVRHSQRHLYRFSSWNTIYRTLLDAIGTERYRLGRDVTSFATDGTGVQVCFADGGAVRADLLVCADGIGSVGRSTLLPEVEARYAGYVAWRGTVPERELDGPTFDAVHDALTYQVLSDSHVLVYPIPGPDGAVDVGERLVNMVWYRNVAEPDLAAFLTDRDGQPRPVSLPPGSVRDELVDELRCSAAALLAPPIAEVVARIGEPFVQAVFDIGVPRMVFDRACLIGDAAFAVRPHAAAGTAKAVEDGWVLAAALEAAGGDVPAALAAWEAAQLTLGSRLLERNRDIGDSSQFTGTFRPGDPRLIFGLYGPGR